MTTTPDTLTLYSNPTPAGPGWRWTLRAAGNHEVIAASTEAYDSRAAAVENATRVCGTLTHDHVNDAGDDVFTVSRT